MVATEVIGSDISDLDLAVRLRDVLISSKMTGFKSQLLDVIVTNAADLMRGVDDA